MLTLDHANIPALDWIIVADTDELYTFGYPTLAETTAKMEAQGATYALGEMLDHVARNGSLSKLQVGLKACLLQMKICKLDNTYHMEVSAFPTQICVHFFFHAEGLIV